jgi:hypothetical protein
MLKFTSFLSTVFLLFLGITLQAQTACPAPYIVSTEADSTKITVKWASQSTTANANTTYTLEYALAPTLATATWTALPATPDKTLTIPNLTKCAYYSVRVKSNCTATSSSPWSPVISTKTKGCVVCLKPSFTSITEIDSTSLVVYWQRGTSSSFQVQYTASPVTANSVWITGNGSMLPSPHYQVTGLQKCKEYTFRVRANCSQLAGTTPDYSEWSEYKFVKTKGCVTILPCLAPATVNAIADSNKIVLSWLPSAITGATYTMEYTAAPFSATSIWTTATSTTPTFTMGNLSKCKEYAYRVKTNCSATASSGWSSYKVTKTTGCAIIVPCQKTEITNYSADSTKITFSWGAIAGSTYQVQYAAAPITTTTTWISVTTTTNPATITGLEKCKEYVVRVRTACANNTFSDWSNKTIKTKGCVVVPPCVKPTFAAAADSNKITLSWTSLTNNYQIEYATITSTTTATPTWIPVPAPLSNPTIITGLAKCTYYSVRMRSICANGLFSEWETKGLKTTGCVVVLPCQTPNFLLYPDSTSFKMGWLPTAGSTYVAEYTAAPMTATSVWTSIPTTATSFPIIINGLAKCKEYVVRMRCANANNWETKTVKTTGCVQINCPKPVIVGVVEDSTKVSFAWVALTGMTYQVAYTTAPVLATSTWSNVTVTSNPLTINGLSKCKEYVVRIRTVCASDYFSEWETKTFKTKGCPIQTPCIKPALLTSTPITGGVTLSWTGTSQCYQVRYAKKTTGTAVWKTDSVCTKTHTIIDLDACTFYAWQVRSRCSDGVWGEWTSKATFETGGCSERIAKVMTLSPNPGTHLNVAYYLRKAGHVSVEITNLQGISIGKYELGKQEAGGNTYSLDDLNFAAGTYLVFIKVNGVRLEVQRWIKSVE